MTPPQLKVYRRNPTCIVRSTEVPPNPNSSKCRTSTEGKPRTTALSLLRKGSTLRITQDHLLETSSRQAENKEDANSIITTQSIINRIINRTYTKASIYLLWLPFKFRDKPQPTTHNARFGPFPPSSLYLRGLRTRRPEIVSIPPFYCSGSRRFPSFPCPTYLHRRPLL